MKSGHGCFRRMRTRRGSGASTACTRSLSIRAEAPRYRSNENFTSSAVTGSPLWNLTPARRTSSTTRPSADTFHDSASAGAMGLPGSGLSIASCNAYRTTNGVMIPDVSAGSNHVGASAKWTPQTICSSGAAERAGTAVSTRRSVPVTRPRTTLMRDASLLRRGTAEAIADEDLQDVGVGTRRQPEPDAGVELPARPQVQVDDRKDQVLLPPDRIEPRHGSDRAVVFDARADRPRDVVADLRVRGELEAAPLLDALALEAPVEHGVERGIPGPDLLVDDRTELERPGVGGERRPLVADLDGEAQPDGHAPALGSAYTGPDVVADPRPAAVGLDAREEVDARLE